MIAVGRQAPRPVSREPRSATHHLAGHAPRRKASLYPPPSPIPYSSSAKKLRNVVSALPA
ncbi:hypothetical protein ACRRTK_016388 [Alexandromys fortis]